MDEKALPTARYARLMVIAVLPPGEVDEKRLARVYAKLQKKAARELPGYEIPFAGFKLGETLEQVV